MIFSFSAELAIQQGFFALLGLLIYLLISQIDYRVLRNMFTFLYVVILVLLLLVQIIGAETRGAIRWIPLGVFNIQPSELSKPILILFLSSFWAANLPSWKNILKSILFLLPALLLIFRQPDLGTALTVASIWLGILLLTNISLKKVAIFGLVIALSLPMIWFSLQDYQKQRLSSFFSPASDPLGVGYNLIQSSIAVGSGALLGQGLGHGTQSRLKFLPEYRTDFIFAAIAEEFGLLGSFFLILIYSFLVIYCLRSAKAAPDFFGFLICVGVAVMLLFQALVNIGMNVGLLPITGITLPLVSYGGSSLVSMMFSLGLVASVSRWAEDYKKELTKEE